jgi:ABC-type transporter Mla subunit MlaD
MTELGNLERNLRRLSGDLARVQKPVDRTHAAVKGTKSVLAKPRQLSLAMKRLSSKARSLRYTALFLIPFPVIGTLAGRIAKVLRSVRRTADRAKRAADRMDRKVKPAKNAVAKVHPPVSKAKQSLDRAQALLRGWLSVTEEMNRRFGDRPPEDVESACGGMNAALAPEMKAIAEKRAALTQSLNAVGGGFEGVARAGKPVADALAAADDLNRALRPLEGPLKELNKALKPVKWALDAVSWVTSKIIDPIVNEILKAVGLKKLVGKLERSLNPLARTVAPLERAVNAMERSVARLTGSTKLVTSLDKIPELETRVVAAMKPLRRLATRA